MMGHPAKHPIDPDTGLCDICDRDAIHEIRQGKRPAKRIIYVEQDERLTHHSNDDEIYYVKDDYPYETHDEPTPRYSRKAVYPEHTVRPRRAVYEQTVEEPIAIRRPAVRRDRLPQEEVIIRRRPAHQTARYYVDEDDRRISRISSPPRETSRRVVVQHHSPPPRSPSPTMQSPGGARQVHVIRRHAQTPPLKPVPQYHSGPRRHVNSDTEIIERKQRRRRDDFHESPSPSKKPELYHINSPFDDDFEKSNSPVDIIYDSRTPPPRKIYQDTPRRKPAKLDPIDRRFSPQPIPTVVKRSYKKLPPGKEVPFDDNYDINSKPKRPVRKGDKNQPSQHYYSSPSINNGKNRDDTSARDPSIYFIRPSVKT